MALTCDLILDSQFQSDGYISSAKMFENMF